MRNVLLLILGTAIALLSCGRAGSQQYAISFWAMGVEGEAVRDLVPWFERSHPGTRVRVQSIPWSAAHEKLLTAFAGGALPDAAQLGNTWLPEFHAIGALLPVDSVVIAAHGIPINQYFPGIWETNRIGDRLYGVPWYADTRVLFYRTTLFDSAGIHRPPSDWGEWFETCRKLKRRFPSRYPIFFSLARGDWQVPVILILQNGGNLLAQSNTRSNFSDPRVREALEFYLLFFKHGYAPARMTEFVNVLQAFASGYVAMMITGPWNLGELRKRFPQLENAWATATLPCHRNCMSVAGGSSLVIFKNSRRPDLVAQWLAFLSRPDVQVRFFELTGDLPPRRDSWERGNLLRDEKLHAFYQQLEKLTAVPGIAEWEQVATKMQEHLERAVASAKPLTEVLEDLDRDIDQILEKRRWLIEHGYLR